MKVSLRHASIPVEATREYDVGISTEPGQPSMVLRVKVVGEGNRPYWNAMFKRLNAAPVTPSRPVGAIEPKFSPEQLERGRVDAIDIYAHHIVVGWRNVTEDGKPAAWSPAATVDLLTALVAPPPDGRPDLFDAMRRFCETADNFTAATVEAAELGKV